MYRLIALALSLTLFNVQADEATIRKTLGERYPGIVIQAVTPTPMAGVWEVWAGGRLVYTDGTGDYLIVGTLVETRSKRNLSQQRLDELRAVKFDSLPLDKSFTIVKGKGERRLAVFTDPDCPFCRRLEQELAKLDNLTVHVFLYPLAELHPRAPQIARNVWCAPDRAKTWLAYMLEGKTPEAVENCEAPLQAIAELGARLGVEGTPAIFFANGKRVDGYLPAHEIEAILQQGS
jgi:thiol:disulfide interchange protein DsbC